MAATRPGWASLVASLTAPAARAVRLRKNANQPAPSFAGGDVQPEDLVLAFSVDARGDQCAHVDDPAGLTDLHRQRIRGHERVGAGVERSGAERLDVRVELLGHDRDL